VKIIAFNLFTAAADIGIVKFSYLYHGGLHIDDDADQCSEQQRYSAGLQVSMRPVGGICFPFAPHASKPQGYDPM
jgi:hypothetical protein